MVNLLTMGEIYSLCIAFVSILLSNTTIKFTKVRFHTVSYRITVVRDWIRCGIVIPNNSVFWEDKTAQLKLSLCLVREWTRLRCRKLTGFCPFNLIHFHKCLGHNRGILYVFIYCFTRRLWVNRGSQRLGRMGLKEHWCRIFSAPMKGSWGRDLVKPNKLKRLITSF